MQVLSPMVGIHLMYYDCHTTPLRAHHGMECFFATTGDLPISTTFWGGVRPRVICSGSSPVVRQVIVTPKSWLPQITWNTASMRA